MLSVTPASTNWRIPSITDVPSRHIWHRNGLSYCTFGAWALPANLVNNYTHKYNTITDRLPTTAYELSKLIMNSAAYLHQIKNKWKTKSKWWGNRSAKLVSTEFISLSVAIYSLKEIYGNSYKYNYHYRLDKCY